MRRLFLFLTLFLASTVCGFAANHRYWRVYVTAYVGGDSIVSCAELAMHSTIGGSNIVTGGTAEESSEYSSTYTASKCFDGNTGTQWCSAATGVPQWIGYDFGLGNAVNVVEIVWTGESGPYAYRNPEAFLMQYSDNNSSWYTSWSPAWPSLPHTWSAGESVTFQQPSSSTYVDSTASKTAGTSTSYTFTQNIMNSTNGMWCVFVGFVDTNLLSAVTSIADTTDSTSFTFIRKDGAYVNADSVECWCMLGSSYSTGTKTVTVTVSPAPGQESIVGSIALTGIKQSLTPDAGATAYSTSGGGFAQPSTTIVTVTNNDVVIDGFIDNSAETNPAATSPQVSFYNEHSDRGGFGSFNTPVTPAGTNYMAWTGLTGSWRQTVLAWAPFVSYAPKHHSIVF
jgi:hypothetical protein